MIYSYDLFHWPEFASERKNIINPLKSNIHIQILQTGLHTFPLRMSKENLIKDQGIFSLVIILLILITWSLNNGLDCMDC